jgi:hypothetical protein
MPTPSSCSLSAPLVFGGGAGSARPPCVACASHVATSAKTDSGGSGRSGWKTIASQPSPGCTVTSTSASSTAARSLSSTLAPSRCSSSARCRPLKSSARRSTLSSAWIVSAANTNPRFEPAIRQELGVGGR